MPQLQLPIFAGGVTSITRELGYERRDGRVTYFNGAMPVFSHAQDDLATFRLITSQFCVNGNCKQPDIVRAFGVPLSTVKRYCALYRKKGPAGFYAPPVRRGAAVLTEPVVKKIQAMLDEGQEPSKVAEELGIKWNTLQKAIAAGKLHAQKKKPSTTLSSKSTRSAADSEAAMGMGATDTVGRVMASVGMLAERPVQFDAAMDVANGGVLLSLPALLANGLLRHTNKYFQLPAGYYGIASIFLLLALMSLSRLKHPEALRYCAPGEWGKLLGLDRIPEVKTLRNKLRILSEQGQTREWSAQLCEDWMEDSPQDSSVLYVDGHVRVYHGEQTKLPRHYVSRERLCLRATTDYWVNAMDGRPFFVINEAVDPGLLKVLSEEIVPRLLRDVPGQPSEQQLQDNPLLHRFTIVFDREGYSPDFLLQCRKKRVACLTYHKYPGPDWPVEEFIEQNVSVNQAPPTTMKLAERGVKLSNGLWVREVRKLSENGHQTSVLSTDYCSDVTGIAARMFARWTQENFFRYMRQHYNLDRIIDYQTEPLDETTMVVNPDWRRLDAQVRSKVGLLHRKLSKFGQLQLDGDIEPCRVEHFERTKAALQQQIQEMQTEVAELKHQRKATAHHITVAQLPEDQRFSRLNTKSKDFIDTIKMISYRAETAMALILREHMSRLDDARTLLREIYTTEADMIPDLSAGTLTVRIHHMANRAADTVVQHLCDELNATMTRFPGTDLRLVYELVRNRPDTQADSRKLASTPSVEPGKGAS